MTRTPTDRVIIAAEAVVRIERHRATLNPNNDPDGSRRTAAWNEGADAILELDAALLAYKSMPRTRAEPGYCTDRLCREVGPRHLHEALRP